MLVLGDIKDMITITFTITSIIIAYKTYKQGQGKSKIYIIKYNSKGKKRSHKRRSVRKRKRHRK